MRNNEIINVIYLGVRFIIHSELYKFFRGRCHNLKMFLKSYTVKSVERKCIKYVKQLEEYTKAYDLELSEPNIETPCKTHRFLNR